MVSLAADQLLIARVVVACVGEQGHVRPLCALYVLERLLHVVTHPRLVNFLAAALLLGAAQPRHRAPAPAPASKAAEQRGDSTGDAGEVPEHVLRSCSWHTACSSGSLGLVWPTLA